MIPCDWHLLSEIAWGFFMQPSANIPPRFHPAYRHIEQLARHERYQAALIFGSLARGEAMDVRCAFITSDRKYSRSGYLSSTCSLLHGTIFSSRQGMFCLKGSWV